MFGALRVEDGKSLTFTSRSRNSRAYIKLLYQIERAVPKGLIYLIAENLKTHKSVMVREWLEDHPTIEHAFTSRRDWRGSISSRLGGGYSENKLWPDTISPTATK